jgi:hypothetical protein
MILPRERRSRKIAQEERLHLRGPDPAIPEAFFARFHCQRSKVPVRKCAERSFADTDYRYVPHVLGVAAVDVGDAPFMPFRDSCQCVDAVEGSLGYAFHGVQVSLHHFHGLGERFVTVGEPVDSFFKIHGVPFLECMPGTPIDQWLQKCLDDHMLRKVAAYSWFGVAVAVLYVGYIFLARHDENQKLAHQTAEHEAEQAHEELEKLGGDSLKILQFYAPPTIAKGQTGKLCYGVVNAKTVTLDPPVDRMWPALTRCIEITPRKDTVYTLVATDAGGHSIHQEVTVQVR